MRSQKGSGLVVFTLTIVVLILIFGVAAYTVMNSNVVTDDLQVVNANSTNEESSVDE